MAKKKARRKKKAPRKKAKRKKAKRPAKAAASMFGTATPTPKKAGRRRKPRYTHRAIKVRRRGKFGSKRLGVLRRLLTRTGKAVTIRRDITYWKTEKVESSWLTHIHLVEVGVGSRTEDRPRLAITYKSGVTCYYIETKEIDYNRMAAGISKGHMVHLWYYDQPYIVI